MELPEIYDKEKMALREELHNLKNCQVTFLTFSVTATGALLGITATLVSKPFLGFIFLFPLIILLPIWWIFFDKAIAITRIVGYYRILEGLILQNYSLTAKFIGWENALRKFKEQQVSNKPYSPKLEKPPRRVLIMKFLQTGNRYWVISYCIFLALSLLCVVVSMAFLKISWFLAMPALIFVISALFNAWVVWRLIYGSYSPDYNEAFWMYILDVNLSQEAVFFKIKNCKSYQFNIAYSHYDIISYSRERAFFGSPIFTRLFLPAALQRSSK